MGKSIKIFISYAHEDEALRIYLEKHLALLKRQGLVTTWHNRNISAGTEWADEIDTHLQEAEIILLLVSADFLESDYCYSVEMKRAIERHKYGEACVIPIILRPVFWQEASLPNKRLKVFISSGGLELHDVGTFVANALDKRDINAKVYEDDGRPRQETATRERSFAAIDEADIYVGLFWGQYKEAMSQEYRYARSLQKPCFVYIRDKNHRREKELEDFLKAEIYTLHQGTNYDFFDDAIKLGEQVANDITTWLVRQYRDLTSEILQARVSEAERTRLEAEVNHLQALSRQSLQQGTAVDYLAQQLRAWFKTLNYSFEKYEVRVDDYFEWIINIPKRRGYDRILVYGIEGEAKVHHIIALRKAIDARKVDEGWIVAVRRIGQAAREVLEKEENRNLFCYTLDELLDENANFDGYLRWLEAEVKQRGIDKMYVPLACTKEEFDPATQQTNEGHYDEDDGWIDGYIDRWLSDPSKEHISILGEFGTGKTWFALHYAWTVMQHYRDAKTRGIERPRLPLVIPLRDYAKAISVESLFSEFFFRKHEIPLPGYSAFEQLNRMGKLLLIFDGFDEMAAKVDRQKMIDNFWELARVVVPGAKVILTCRTEHFPEAKMGRALLNAELQASVAKLTGERPQFEILNLNYFNDTQIRRVLSLRAEVDSTVELVMNNPQLLDLARRPVMTELILEALLSLTKSRLVDTLV